MKKRFRKKMAAFGLLLMAVVYAIALFTETAFAALPAGGGSSATEANAWGLVSLLTSFMAVGLVVNAGTLTTLYKGFKTVFNEVFAATTTYYEKVATLVPSSVREETYGWLGAFPRMREWIGDRVVENLKTHGYSIKNKDFESTIEVDRNDIDDDSYGVYKPFFGELARAAKTHYDDLVFPLLKNGFTTTCYDGQYFFDTDHPVGGASVSNTAAGAGNPWFLLDVSKVLKPLILQKRKDAEFVSMDRPDDENVFMRKKFRYGVDCRDNAGYGLWQLAYGAKSTLTADNYSAARAAMIAFKDDKGKPLGVMPNLLVVGPSNEKAAREILMVERNAAGATNPWQNTAELIVVSWLD